MISPHTALIALLPLISASWIPRQASSAASAASSVVSASPALNSVVSTLSPSSTAATTAPTSGSGSGTPRVTIYPANSPSDGVTLTGVRNAALGTDAYLGIPFAAPPVGNLRFSPPQDPTWTNTTFSATRQPPACLQRNSTQYGTYGYSEDCLYLNVFTPPGANATNAYLPVLVWVYGGGFTSGAASLYNASLINAAGVQSNRPFITVVMNYRLGFLGWPYGQEIAANGAANLGLKDVQLALEWTKNNIWAFGGDPSRTTLAGQSAGAIAISLLMLQQNIDLFRSVILLSGGASTAPIARTDSAWEDVYRLIVQSTNCNVTSAATGTGNSTASANGTSSAANYSSSFECLKARPADQILAAQAAVQGNIRYGSSFIFAPSIDGDLIPDSPHNLIGSGRFAKKPMINGNVKDEGTIFVPRQIASGQVPLLLSAIVPTPPSNATLAQLLQLYPDVPALGSPYGTGNETFGLSSGFKQATSIIGDNAFQAQRRWLIQNTQQYYPDTPVYSYFFNQSTPGAQPYLGVSHGSDVPYYFGFTYAGGNYTDADRNVTQVTINYWLNFIYNQDPNGANATNWPAYGGSSQQNLLKIQAGNYSVIRDNYREEQIAFFNSQPQQFSLRKRSHLVEDEMML